MRRRWLVVKTVGKYRVVVARCWTERGARSYVKGMEAWHDAANQRACKWAAPGSPPLLSPSLDLTVEEATHD